MTLTLTGIGLATPRYQIGQTEACELTLDFACDTEEQRRLMTTIYRYSGVRQRGSVVLQAEEGDLSRREQFFLPRSPGNDHGPGTAERMRLYQAEAGPLAVKAARAALVDAEASPREVTHLITGSCSGFAAPGMDIELIRALELPPGVARTHVGFMGCHGGFNALRVANAFLTADPTAVALVCCVELCSLHHFYGWDVEKVVANALFADGAGAFLCRGEDGADHAALRIAAQGSVVLADTLEAMSWSIGDHGFEMTLSPEVPTLIENRLRPWLEEFLRHQGLKLDEVGSWAIHPGGPRILDACRKALGLTEPDLVHSRQVLADHGNMSSATLFFLLDRLNRRESHRPIVALGFGPGLTIEAMLLE